MTCLTSDTWIMPPLLRKISQAGAQILKTLSICRNPAWICIMAERVGFQYRIMQIADYTPKWIATPWFTINHFSRFSICLCSTFIVPFISLVYQSARKRLCLLSLGNRELLTPDSWKCEILFLKKKFFLWNQQRSSSLVLVSELMPQQRWSSRGASAQATEEAPWQMQHAISIRSQKSCLQQRGATEISACCYQANSTTPRLTVCELPREWVHLYFKWQHIEAPSASLVFFPFLVFGWLTHLSLLICPEFFGGCSSLGPHSGGSQHQSGRFSLHWDEWLMIMAGGGREEWDFGWKTKVWGQ